MLILIEIQRLFENDRKNKGGKINRMKRIPFFIDVGDALLEIRDT